MNYLLIDCENDTSEALPTKANNRFLTRKTDKTNHGIGLSNIQSVVEKYDGEMNVQVENGKFIIKTTMILPQKEAVSG